MQVASLDVDPDYGIGGCKAYDAGSQKEGCGDNESSHCNFAWCYVDPALCPEDEDKCEAGNGVLGNEVSPYCRTREVIKSSQVSADYSYATCGTLSSYKTNMLFKSVAGNVVQVAIKTFEPFILTLEKEHADIKQRYGGPTFDFFEAALMLFQPELEMMEVDATNSSKARYPDSSYTACVHDVAVGNFDLCVADLWVTEERAQLTAFLPSLREDYFYFVTRRIRKQVTFADRVQRPFLPFTTGAWFLVVVFLIGLAVVLWKLMRDFKVLDGSDEPCPWSAWHGLKDLGFIIVLVLMDFMSRELTTVKKSTTKGAPRTVDTLPPRGMWGFKVFSLAFSFFVLVCLSSYTAYLASLLVIQNNDNVAFKSLDDAIAKDVKICVPGVLRRTFSKKFPRGKFIPVENIEDLPKALLSKNCSGIVTSYEQLKMMHSGKTKAADCKNATEEIMEREEICGEARDDCDFNRVGDILHTVPLSLPVSDRLMQSLSWGVIHGHDNGLYAQLIVNNSDNMPTSRCGDVQEEREGGLYWEDLVGAIFVAFLVMCVGLLLEGVISAYDCCFNQRSYGWFRKQQGSDTENLASFDSGADMIGRDVPETF